jgi:hypothetical protein
MLVKIIPATAFMVLLATAMPGLAADTFPWFASQAQAKAQLQERNQVRAMNGWRQHDKNRLTQRNMVTRRDTVTMMSGSGRVGTRVQRGSGVNNVGGGRGKH